MTDFRDRLETQLRLAGDRQAAGAPRRRPRRRFDIARPALALAAAAVVLVLVVRAPSEPERTAGPPPAGPVPASLLGTYRGEGPTQLWIQPQSVRVLSADPAVQSELLGFATVEGDRITLAVDERAAADPFPGPFCEEGRVGDRGTYRFAREGAALVFRLVEDPCRGRARLLTGTRWRRAP